MGIGDWGLGIAIPNTQSPIPKIYRLIFIIKFIKKFLKPITFMLIKIN
jgi:hypothetical protein